MQYKGRDYLGLLSLLLLILSFTITLTIWAIPLYKFSLNHLNIPETVGLSFDQIMHNYYELLRYLHLPWVKTLSLADFPVSASGAFHFYEVKLLFYANYIVLFVSGIFSFFYLQRLKERRATWKLVQPFQFAIFLPFVLLLILMIDFNWMFEMFHAILFNNDAWLFNPMTDPIINVLPQEYFMYCFIFAFTLIESIFITGYFYFKNK